MQESNARICPDDGYQTVDASLYSDLKKDPLLGTTFNNRYRVEELIGIGGMSTVYRATQLNMDRTVALKVMDQGLVKDLRTVLRFQQEARAAASLEHPNTVRVFDFGQTDDGILFMAMQYLEGESLNELIEREAPLQPDRVMHMASQVLDALAEAHSQGIIHRDLKPDNLFVTKVGRQDDFVKILDFGIAKIVDSEERSTITEAGRTVGSPRYMSPEQARAEEVTARTDLYGLGCILYEMLCGRPVFVCKSPAEYLVAHVHEKPRPPQVGQHVMRGKLIDLVMRCLEKNPEDRPEDAVEAMALLEACWDSPVSLASVGLDGAVVEERRGGSDGVATNKRLDDVEAAKARDTIKPGSRPPHGAEEDEDVEDSADELPSISLNDALAESRESKPYQIVDDVPDESSTTGLVDFLDPRSDDELSAPHQRLGRKKRPHLILLPLAALVIGVLVFILVTVNSSDPVEDFEKNRVKVDNPVASADDYMKREQWQKAINQYERALSQDSSDEAARQGLKMAHAELKTEQVYQRVREAMENGSLPEANRAVDELLEAAEESVAYKKKSAELADHVRTAYADELVRVGADALAKEKYRYALNLSNRALQLVPEHSGAKAIQKEASAQVEKLEEEDKKKKKRRKGRRGA